MQGESLDSERGPDFKFVATSALTLKAEIYHSYVEHCIHSQRDLYRILMTSLSSSQADVERQDGTDGKFFLLGNPTHVLPCI